MSNSNNCPSCGSNDWKYAEIVYKQGLTYVESTGEQHQTDLSKRATPPQPSVGGEASTGLGILTFFIGFPIVYFSSPEVTFWGAFFSGKLWLAMFIVVLVAMVLGLDKETPESKDQYIKNCEEWRNTKVCMRCSHFFK